MKRTSRRHKLLLITGILSAGAIALAGCSPASSGAPGSASPNAKSSGQTTLVIYSAQGYDHAAAAAFQKATGIPVKLDDNSTGPLLTQIEASRNNPNWGLLWVDGATAFAGLDQQGLLLKGFEPKVSWNSLGAQSVPTDKSYTPTGVTLMAALVYNKVKVKSPPATWQDLLQPTLQALTSGQIKLALVQSSAGIGAVLGDKSLAVKYLDPVTLLPSAIGIDAKAPPAEQAEAKKFIEWVLSPAGQHVMQTGDPTGDSLYYPVLPGTSPLAALPSLASVKTQTINPYTWGPREATINTWFDSNIVR